MYVLETQPDPNERMRPNRAPDKGMRPNRTIPIV